MDKLIKPGRIVYAVGIIALGVLCFIMKDFIVGRPPAASWAANIPGKLVWAYVSGSLLILAGLAVIFNVKGGTAALLVGIMIVLFSFILRHLYEMVDWINAYKALALAGGSFVVAASFFQKGGSAQGLLASNGKLIFIGCLFFSFFFIISGLAHFRFAEFIIKDFIPDYIPFHPFWTYFAGVCLLAGGLGLLIPGLRKWAALLSGIMIGSWFFLVHAVRFANDPNNGSDRLGLCESFTLAGILFVLAGMLSRKQ
ncbi:MAG TPA: hypothetical protein VFI06_08650 [Chitinophagaceae bacterium]|nr:hypothetical protein [Chitinophagaceae bacterium]